MSSLRSGSWGGASQSCIAVVHRGVGGGEDLGGGEHPQRLAAQRIEERRPLDAIHDEPRATVDLHDAVDDRAVLAVLSQEPAHRSLALDGDEPVRLAAHQLQHRADRLEEHLRLAAHRQQLSSPPIGRDTTALRRGEFGLRARGRRAAVSRSAHAGRQARTTHHCTGGST